MKKTLVFLLCVLLFFALTISIVAHSGRTDGNGGHWDNSANEYHYHHGYPAHQHENGICPYKEETLSENAAKSPGIVERILILLLLVIPFLLFLSFLGAIAIYEITEDFLYAPTVEYLIEEKYHWKDWIKAAPIASIIIHGISFAILYCFVSYIAVLIFLMLGYFLISNVRDACKSMTHRGVIAFIGFAIIIMLPIAILFSFVKII